MRYSSGLTAQLSALTTTLGNPGPDLQAILEVLVDDLFVAVSSFVGLTMTHHFDGFAVTMTAIDADPTRGACSSLELPLDMQPTGGLGTTVVLYASERGAFAELAAEFQRTNGVDPRFIVDGPVPNPMPRSGVYGLAEMSAVNRAIGVLITRGYFPAEAHAELHRRAGDGLDTVPDAARRVLMSTNAPPPCGTIPVLNVNRRPERRLTVLGRLAR